MSATTPLLAEVAARAAAHLDEADEFVDRLARNGSAAVEHLTALYGGHSNAHRMLLEIFDVAIEAAANRSQALAARDRQREKAPRWYQRHDLVGAWVYVDRFSGTINALADHLQYLDDLGIGYLHLMPIFARPEDQNDGGYAVSSYRALHPPLGKIEDMRKLAAALHDRGISLAVDFVFNHTASTHPWALAAAAGNPMDRDCYLTFETEEETLAYQPRLRAIFPDEKPGSFVFDETMQRWVWATFHDYQWDLNYRNPEVFRRMLDEMLFLANLGVDVLRLDAVPFIWKEPGTTCEGLPQAHTIIRAFNALIRIAAPAMIFKSEAIVHPDEVRSYLGTEVPDERECEISYNPLLMVELWEALATGYTHLLRASMENRFAIPRGTGWVNYVRSHDDIGWGFADEDATAVHIDGGQHRSYLNRVYTGQEPGSVARGVPFQINPVTGDARLSGTTASLAGLEHALLHADQEAIDHAVRRILLLYGVVFATPGLPLLNLGDELGTLNDPSYLYDPELAADSRWIHRPAFDWERARRRTVSGTIEARIYAGIATMVRERNGLPELRGGSTCIPRDVGNDHVYVAAIGGGGLVVLANFTGDAQSVAWGLGSDEQDGVDVLTGIRVSAETTLDPYQVAWVKLD